MIGLGPQCNAFVKGLGVDVETLLRKRCLDFYITAATKMQKRLPLKDEFFGALEFLKPEVAIEISKPTHIRFLQAVWVKFEKLDDVNGSLIDAE